jgi:hypothetical protein
VRRRRVRSRSGRENKYFAPGVGMIAEVKTAVEEGRAELIEYLPAG